MAEFSEYDGFGELNALGNPDKIKIESYDGGRAGVGPVGNTRPTGIVADGIDISQKRDYADQKVRRGMSTEKNESTKKMMGSRK